VKGTKPFFGKLSIRECEQVLRRHRAGRIAFALGSRVDIEPISYVYSAGWIFGRTQPGTKMSVLGHQPWVAFEVDEIKGPFDWRSVVVHGTFQRLHAEGSEVEENTYRRALRILRRAFPGILGPNDPVPERTILFGIHIDAITGRTARAGGG
jgi:nitroimidazol reductase NimA-like FMN-containing flavoprotein (pyridoxamine 5'-phosphate oxidase superfamily)